jgi:AcrR family transcriptional regulator
MNATRSQHARVTRHDWLRAARAALVAEGVDRVRVAVIADQLGVARSSFYWHYADRDELLTTLVDEWELTNTTSILDRAARPADTITGALLHVFECWADPSLFDVPLEFAIRAWSRHDPAVQRRLEAADDRRIAALTALHRRFGCTPTEALVRSRVQYHSQIGLYALGVEETHQQRLRLLPTYLRVFTGVDASDEELARFRGWLRTVSRR